MVLYAPAAVVAAAAQVAQVVAVAEHLARQLRVGDGRQWRVVPRQAPALSQACGEVAKVLLQLWVQRRGGGGCSE